MLRTSLLFVLAAGCTEQLEVRASNSIATVCAGSGSSTVVDIQLDPDPYGKSVSFTISGLPGGVSARFGQPLNTYAHVLVLSAEPSAPAATSEATIKADDGDSEAETQMTVQVTGPCP